MSCFTCGGRNGILPASGAFGGDSFVDLEGDPFVGENGLQYLFGFAVLDVPEN